MKIRVTEIEANAEELKTNRSLVESISDAICAITGTVTGSTKITKTDGKPAEDDDDDDQG